MDIGAGQAKGQLTREPTGQSLQWQPNGPPGPNDPPTGRKGHQGLGAAAAPRTPMDLAHPTHLPMVRPDGQVGGHRDGEQGQGVSLRQMGCMEGFCDT